MRWQGGRQSENVEDRRGMRGGPVMVGGGMTTLLILALVWFLGGDPIKVLQQIDQGQPGGQAGPLDPGQPESGATDEQREFVAVVLGDTEDVWREQFKRVGEQYRDPKLVLFSGQVDSACGLADAAVGPFYCPADDKIYLDMVFFRELEQHLHVALWHFAEPRSPGAAADRNASSQAQHALE